MSLESGERFTDEIEYVTKSGKGTVKRGHDTINIGPVTCEGDSRFGSNSLANKITASSRCA